MIKFRRLLWKLFGTPDVPPKASGLRYFKTNLYSGEDYIPRYYLFYKQYNEGWSLESIAHFNKVTRERVRQCIWKAYNELAK